ncbi:MAG: hypothetical protein ACPIE8_06175, partial [Henriciella sp.]
SSKEVSYEVSEHGPVNTPCITQMCVGYTRIRLFSFYVLKLFLTSFRNHGAFHEDCTIRVGKTVAELLDPRWIRISGYWYPRGGIPIDVFWQSSAIPDGLYVPETGVAPYRGRG